MLLGNLFFQIFQNRGRRVNSDVSHNKDLFQILVKFLVYAGITAENGIKTGYNIVSCLCKSAYKTFKKSLFFFSHFSLSPCYLVSWFSTRSTDTRVETPFSCMVIPYSRSAAFMVPRLCVIIINWVFFVNF